MPILRTSLFRIFFGRERSPFWRSTTANQNESGGNEGGKGFKGHFCTATHSTWRRNYKCAGGLLKPPSHERCAKISSGDVRGKGALFRQSPIETLQPVSRGCKIFYVGEISSAFYSKTALKFLENPASSPNTEWRWIAWIHWDIAVCLKRVQNTYLTLEKFQVTFFYSKTDIPASSPHRRMTYATYVFGREESQVGSLAFCMCIFHFASPRENSLRSCLLKFCKWRRRKTGQHDAYILRKKKKRGHWERLPKHGGLSKRVTQNWAVAARPQEKALEIPQRRATNANADFSLEGPFLKMHQTPHCNRAMLCNSLSCLKSPPLDLFPPPFTLPTWSRLAAAFWLWNMKLDSVALLVFISCGCKMSQATKKSGRDRMEKFSKSKTNLALYLYSTFFIYSIFVFSYHHQFLLSKSSLFPTTRVTGQTPGSGHATQVSSYGWGRDGGFTNKATWFSCTTHN